MMIHCGKFFMLPICQSFLPTRSCAEAQSNKFLQLRLFKRDSSGRLSSRISNRLQSYLAHFPASVLKMFPYKNLLYFFLKTPALTRFSYFLIKSFSNFEKRNFLIFREMYIHNPGIFRTRGIFRTLVYSEPEAYSEHCQTSTIERFVKIAIQRTSRPQHSKLFPKTFHSKKIK